MRYTTILTIFAEKTNLESYAQRLKKQIEKCEDIYNEFFSDIENVFEKLKDDWFYKEYNGKSLFVPKEPFFRPNLLFLKHHREHVFETFKQIRKKEELKTESRNPIVTQEYLFAAEADTRD